jgi:hypothetical protein
MLWQMNKCSSALGTYYDDKIESLYHLIHKSFVKQSAMFANALRMVFLTTILICLNMYMGSQSEAVMCKLTEQCGDKYDTLTRVSFNIMSLSFIFSDSIKIVS